MKQGSIRKPKKKFVELAEVMANKSHDKFRLGSVLVKGNRVISVGFNEMSKFSAKSTHPFKSLHAEQATIIDADREEIEGSILYIVRKRKIGDIGCSKPCVHCEHMLRRVRVKGVFYTDDDGVMQWESYE